MLIKVPIFYFIFLYLKKNSWTQHKIQIIWFTEYLKKWISKTRFRHLVRSFPSFFSDYEISISLESTSILKAFDFVHVSDLNMKTSVGSRRLTGKAE